MECVYCGHHDTKVDQSESSTHYVYRSRKCKKCARRFKTTELPRVMNNFTASEKVFLVTADEAGVPEQTIANLMERLCKEVKETKEKMLDSGEYFDILDQYEEAKRN